MVGAILLCVRVFVDLLVNCSRSLWGLFCHLLLTHFNVTRALGAIPFWRGISRLEFSLPPPSIPYSAQSTQNVLRTTSRILHHLPLPLLYATRPHGVISAISLL